jgi:hypothetical protein
MSPRMLFPFPLAKFFQIYSASAVMAVAGLTAVAQVQGTSVYGDACIKLGAADFANAHGYSNIGFNPAIYSIPGKPFTATRVYTFRSIPAGEMNSPGNASSSSLTPAPDLSEEVIVARDKVGRVHYETRRPAKGEIAIMIYDPIAHTVSQYYLTADRGMPNDAVASIEHFQLMSKLTRPMPATPPAQLGDQSADPVPDKPDPSSSLAVAPSRVAAPKNIDPSPKDLPEQSINGIPVIGHRMVHKYGDKNQYLQIQEEWLSPDYALNLREDIVRESIGESTIETRDVVDGEPDPALFSVPGGYLIRNTKQ